MKSSQEWEPFSVLWLHNLKRQRLSRIWQSEIYLLSTSWVERRLNIGLLFIYGVLRKFLSGRWWLSTWLHIRVIWEKLLKMTKCPDQLYVEGEAPDINILYASPRDSILMCSQDVYIHCCILPESCCMKSYFIYLEGFVFSKSHQEKEFLEKGTVVLPLKMQLTVWQVLVVRGYLERWLKRRKSLSWQSRHSFRLRQLPPATKNAQMPMSTTIIYVDTKFIP